MCSAECQTLMKLGFYLPWICVSLECMHIWIGCAENSVRSMLIVFIRHVCFLPSSSVIQVCSELNRYYVSVILCTFIWKLFSVIVSYLLCCLHVKQIILSRIPSWSTKTGPLLKLQWSLGGIVVKALRYKLAGCGFDSRWCHWNFSVT